MSINPFLYLSAFTSQTSNFDVWSLSAVCCCVVVWFPIKNVMQNGSLTLDSKGKGKRGGEEKREVKRRGGEGEEREQ